LQHLLPRSVRIRNYNYDGLHGDKSHGKFEIRCTNFSFYFQWVTKYFTCPVYVMKQFCHKMPDYEVKEGFFISFYDQQMNNCFTNFHTP